MIGTPHEKTRPGKIRRARQRKKTKKHLTSSARQNRKVNSYWHRYLQVTHTRPLAFFRHYLEFFFNRLRLFLARGY